MANKQKRWVADVKTDSTHPPEGLFTKNAPTIARTLASRKVSPKGPASGLRMLTYFINRAGSGLPASRRAELEKANRDLSAKKQAAENEAHCEYLSAWEEDKYVVAFQFKPGATTVVHHALLFLDDNGRARQLAAASDDGQPG